MNPMNPGSRFKSDAEGGMDSYLEVPDPQVHHQVRKEAPRRASVRKIVPPNSELLNTSPVMWHWYYKCKDRLQHAVSI
jgi:hypothetical protein